MKKIEYLNVAIGERERERSDRSHLSGELRDGKGRRSGERRRLRLLLLLLRKWRGGESKSRIGIGIGLRWLLGEGG